jgi:ribonucleoside-diphosphate reductase alpha chain
VNVSDVTSQEDLNNRVGVASFFGTLQAGFSDFHYLRPIWSKTTQKDALLGIGMTGIGSGEILKYDLTIAANTAKVVNSMISEKIGTNEAARLTCIKPSGTTSLVLGTASGIHAWHNDYYLRTMRFNKSEDIATYMMINHPELVEDDLLRPTDTICLRIPVKAPEGSIFRTETAIDTLERVKKFSIEWINEGHINGSNTHNVSATVSIDKSRIYEFKSFNLDEWEMVGEWMWNYRTKYNGLSVLPFSDHTYVQAPFEDCTQEKYETLMKTLNGIDLTRVVELEDYTALQDQAACAGGQCEVTSI